MRSPGLVLQPRECIQYAMHQSELKKRSEVPDLSQLLTVDEDGQEQHEKTSPEEYQQQQARENIGHAL